jgi:hypothetical protein
MATVVTLTRLNVTLYLHCLSCLKLHKSVTIYTLEWDCEFIFPCRARKYVCVAPYSLEALQWANSMSRDFSELTVNKIHLSGNQTPQRCIDLWHYTKISLLDFRLYNQRWGMKLGNKICVCLYSCIGKKIHCLLYQWHYIYFNCIVSCQVMTSRRERKRRERK